MNIDEYLLKAKKVAVLNLMYEALDLMQGYNGQSRADAIRETITEDGKVMSIRRINEVYG